MTFCKEHEYEHTGDDCPFCSYENEDWSPEELTNEVLSDNVKFDRTQDIVADAILESFGIQRSKQNWYDDSDLNQFAEILHEKLVEEEE